MKALENQVDGDHYRTMAIQPIEFCQLNGLLACETLAIKYIARHRKKGGRRDIEKAIHCLQLLLELEYKEEREHAGKDQIDAVNHGLTGSPVEREMVYRKLWKPALVSVDEAIRKRESDIEKLKVIKFAIQEGISDEEKKASDS